MIILLLLLLTINILHFSVSCRQNYSFRGFNFKVVRSSQRSYVNAIINTAKLYFMFIKVRFRVTDAI